MSESRFRKTEVWLRPVTTNDMKDLWIWRNDPETRANSLNHDYVPWIKHVEWFYRAYGSSDDRVMIATSYGVPVGTARLECGPDEVKLSWAVAPEFRHQGFGRAIVKAAIDVCGANEPNKLLVAWILPHNTASLKIAEYLGFAEESRSSTAIVLTRKPK